MLEGFFNAIFGWAVAISPLIGMIFIALIMSIISTISWKYLTDQTLMKSSREHMDKLQAELKKSAGDPKKVSELNSKIMKENLEVMKVQWKQSIKPMVVTMIPFLLVFIWIRKTYEPFGDIFLSMGGIGNYILFSFLFSLILRKVMKVH